jgi:adenine/guanine phosphoribosyltransferase-like PRPP-binding protein
MPRPYTHPAPYELSEHNYLQVEEKMLLYGEPIFINEQPAGSSIFATRMAEVTSQPVDAFLFTASSAIPVADAVRGYYEVLDEKMPHLGFVKANRESSRLTDLAQDIHIQQEAARLRKDLQGAQRVVVIDQFKYTGSTLNQAQMIVRSATADAEVIPITGRWYEQSRPEEVMVGEMSSAHSKFMLTVGRLAAQQHGQEKSWSPSKRLPKDMKAAKL